MNVLMITGDRQLLRVGSNAWERLSLQRGAVEKLDVVYWGKGALTAALRASGRYDVVTSQDPFWRGLVALLVAKNLGAKLNVQVHSDLSRVSLVKHILAHIILRHADSVRVVSEKTKTQVARMGVRGRITILPIFVDLERFRAVARQGHEGKHVLWIGRFEPEKDPLLAVALFKEVVQLQPDATLTMLGEGSLRQRLVEHSEGLPVTFPGWVDPALYLGSADVVLCTSQHESWGASMVEALAAGVPVVAPDVGIAREAGAVVVRKEHMVSALQHVFHSGERGMLRLTLLPAKEWAIAWRSSLA